MGRLDPQLPIFTANCVFAEYMASVSERLPILGVFPKLGRAVLRACSNILNNETKSTIWTMLTD